MSMYINLNSEIWLIEIMNISHVKNEDHFKGVYEMPILNWSMIGIYLLGLISCTGLRLVSWFERSGQAGPYRTLVNQLMSITLDKVRSLKRINLI